MPVGSALGSRVSSQAAGRFSVQLAKVAAVSLLLMLMSIVCPAQQAEAWGRRKPAGTPNIYVNYDKFKDRTYVGYKRGDSKAFVETYVSLEGKECKQLPENYYMRFVSQTNGWRYLDNHELYFLLDNGDYRYHHQGRWIIDNDVLYGGAVREDKTAVIPFEVLERIGQASKVEARYGPDTSPKPGTSKNTRALLAKIEEMCGGGEPEEEHGTVSGRPKRTANE